MQTLYKIDHKLMIDPIGSELQLLVMDIDP
jgi:hypothetical protein